ncbi:MAG: IS200/IS605 family transposase [Bacteroidetes bacterium]|nr:IS200/IS605 family transposase [Bacteroidota bacterium]
MSQSLAKIYLHIVFSTKNREALIDDNIAAELYTYLGGVCAALECTPIQIGGYHDHVHILCLLSRKITVMKLLEEVKKSSSKWMKIKSEQLAHFYWQDGYAAFSVGSSELDRVADYIRHQKEHHDLLTYQDECRKLLKRYDLDYDERYFWD